MSQVIWLHKAKTVVCSFTCPAGFVLSSNFTSYPWISSRAGHNPSVITPWALSHILGGAMLTSYKTPLIKGLQSMTYCLAEGWYFSMKCIRSKFNGDKTCRPVGSVILLLLPSFPFLNEHFHFCLILYWQCAFLWLNGYIMSMSIFVSMLATSQN